MERPLGITILAVLQLVFGVLLLAAGLGSVLFPSGVLESVSQYPELSLDQDIVSIIGGVAIVAGLLCIVLAYGLFRLKKWAWITMLVLLIINIIGDLGSLISEQAKNWQVLAHLLVALVIVYYLFRPEVKRVFGRG